VTDRGRGMSAEVLARIGEPFFTTKPPGRGMGLGLYLARAVFESVGGTLAIDSVPGRGTCITVTMPVDAGRARRPSAAPAPRPTTDLPASGI
jgi:two-component system sensor histidine kinase RegB